MPRTKRLLLAVLLLAGVSVSATDLTLRSPNGDLLVSFDVADDGQLSYAVNYRNDAATMPRSFLGLTTKEQVDLGKNCNNVSVGQTETVRRTWKNPFGERAQVADVYRSATLSFENKPTGIKLGIECRVYDAGLDRKSVV